MNSPSWERSMWRSCRIKRLFIVLALSVLIIFLFSLQESSGPIVLTYSQAQLIGLTSDPAADMCSLLDNTNTIIQAANEPISEESPQSALPPTHFIIDPFPTFNGIAVDALTDRVAMSDENRKSILTYERTAGSNSSVVTEPMWQIIGPQTEAGYIAGVELDSKHREIYAVNNDIEDRIVVFDYDSQGDLAPKRRLYAPHQSWGISLNKSRDEFVISVQQLSSLVVYRREAYGMEAPIRVIQGPHTGMADPHGVRWDESNHEIFVASHGNFTVITPYTASDSNATNQKSREDRGDIGGRFLAPSINVFEETASGDAIPIRTIQGSNTDLNWPMGIDIDKAHDEIAVANNGDNSILMFHRGAKGNVAPVRKIQGPQTGLSSPIGLAIDSDNQELWVANYGDHTALVFALNASGNIAPKRIIRNAPAGTPTGGFGNPYAVAYDSKRDQIMVPNCVSQPRIAFFARTANGNSNPVRIIAGQATHLSRTMHGIAYNARYDEIVVPVALADAVLTFRGGATGSEAPIRVIQGPKTKMIRPHTVAVDEVNDEIIVGDSGGRDVLVFDREANGDVPPKRIIQGVRTGLVLIVGVGVDPVHNRIVAASSSNIPGSQTGLFIFDRMANGDVTPLGIISGTHTGIVRPWQLALDPERGHIFVAAINNLSYPPYELSKPRPNLPRDVRLPSPWDSGSVGFVGVWDISDAGDIPARAMIKGNNTYLVHPAGVAINPKAGEVYATDSVRNGLFTFLSPRLFPKQPRAR